MGTSLKSVAFEHLPLHEQHKFCCPPVPMLWWWVLKYLDIAQTDNAQRRADDLAQPIGPGGRQVLVLDGNGHSIATGLYRSANHYVREGLRRFLVRRHKVAGRGNRRFSYEMIYGELGVLSLERLSRTAPPWALR